MGDGKRETKEYEGSKKSLLHYLIVVTIIISILSQITELQSIMRPIMFAFWGALGICSINCGKIYLSRYTKFYVVIYVVFGLFCMICSLFNENFLKNNYLSALMIPLGATYVGENIATKTGIKIRDIMRIYVWSAVAFAAYVNVWFFPDMEGWLSSQQYVFTSKNSAAQIWCSAFILAFFLFIIEGSKKEKIIYSIASIYLLFVSFISGCRTAFLGAIIAISIYFVFFGKKKMALFILVLAIFLILWHNASVRIYLEHFLQIDKYNVINFNSITSGRGDNWQSGINAFMQSMLVGNGNFYCDCSYISILAESGLIGFLLIESIWIGRIAINFVNGKKTSMKMAIMILTVFYIIESLFEGLPPFGPGVSAFMFWFISGYYYTRRRYYEC